MKPYNNMSILAIFEILFWLPGVNIPQKLSPHPRQTSIPLRVKKPLTLQAPVLCKRHPPAKLRVITGRLLWLLASLRCFRNSGPKAFKRIHENPKVKWGIYIYININIYPLSLLLLPPCFYHIKRKGPPKKNLRKKEKKQQQEQHTPTKKRETMQHTPNTPQHDAPENSPFQVVEEFWKPRLLEQNLVLHSQFSAKIQFHPLAEFKPWFSVRSMDSQSTTLYMGVS